MKPLVTFVLLCVWASSSQYMPPGTLAKFHSSLKEKQSLSVADSLNNKGQNHNKTEAQENSETTTFHPALKDEDIIHVYNATVESSTVSVHEERSTTRHTTFNTNQNYMVNKNKTDDVESEVLIGTKEIKFILDGAVSDDVGVRKNVTKVGVNDTEVTDVHSIMPKKGAKKGNVDKHAGVYGESYSEEGMLEELKSEKKDNKVKVEESMETSKTVPKKGVLYHPETNTNFYSTNTDKGLSDPHSTIQQEHNFDNRYTGTGSGSVPRKGVKSEEEKESGSLPRKGVPSPENLNNHSQPRKGVEEQTEKTESVPRKGVSSPEVSGSSIPRKGVGLPGKASVPRKGVQIPSPEETTTHFLMNSSSVNAEFIASTTEKHTGNPNKSCCMQQTDGSLNSSLCCCNKTVIVTTESTVIEQHSKEVKAKPNATVDSASLNSSQSAHKWKNDAGDDYIPLVVGIIFISIIVVALGAYAYRKTREFWHTRHYTKVDFLLDGLYNDA